MGSKQPSISEEVLSTLGMSNATPRQVEAINALTLGKVPGHAVSSRQGRAGKTFSYVKHMYGNELIRDAFGVLWSYEVLNTQAYNDSSASALVCLTLYIPQEDGSYLEVRTTAVGAHEDTSGKMCKAFMVASAASRGLVKTLLRRFGLGAEFYKNEVQMTAKESWTALWGFAQRKDPTVEQGAVVDALKAVGITKDNLVDRFEQAYSIVNSVVSAPLADVPGDLKEPEDTTSPIAGMSKPDPLVEMAKEELGAVVAPVKGKKINFIELYTLSEEGFGFTSMETKAVLLDKFGKDWFYLDMKTLADTLKEARAQG